MPDVGQYGINDMSGSERREFMAWYDEKKDEIFVNRQELEEYCQDDVTVLRQACEIFRRDLIEVFLEAFTFASSCNKVLRNNFLKPDTYGLILAGGYSCNQNYSKKALM
jgi:hypothetical protein